jgi:BASS family bile acid:Na+ symporter
MIGGPPAGERSVLALATASRHPGVALGITQLVFPGEKAVTAAVLLYLIVSVLVTAPYVAWRKKSLSVEAPLGATPAH